MPAATPESFERLISEAFTPLFVERRHQDQPMLAATSTAIRKDAAAAEPEALIGIAADGMQPHDQPLYPEMACVREEQQQQQQQRPGRCFSRSPNRKLILAMLATIIILAGAVLGLGVYIGTHKGEGGDWG